VADVVSIDVTLTSSRAGVLRRVIAL